jgi:hypothetical protein
LTGLIYAAIVVAWAAYLVPLALRRHDEVSHTRSIERFSSTMRVLSRRGSATAERLVVRPPRPVDRPVDPVLSPTLKSDGASSVATPAVRPTRSAQAAAARRRRLVLIVLATGLVLTGAASTFSLVPLWSGAVPVALIVVFLIVARRQVRKAEESFWSAAAQRPLEPSNVVRRSAVRVDASHGAAKPAMAASSPESTNADDEPTITLSTDEIAAAAPDLTQRRVTAVALSTADGSSLWDPVPVMLPAYVGKPAARRTIRTIELGEPGTWSSGHREDDSETAAAAQAEHAAEAPAEPRRAVNG